MTQKIVAISHRAVHTGGDHTVRPGLLEEHVQQPHVGPDGVERFVSVQILGPKLTRDELVVIHNDMHEQTLGTVVVVETA